MTALLLIIVSGIGAVFLHKIYMYSVMHKISYVEAFRYHWELLKKYPLFSKKDKDGNDADESSSEVK